MDRLGSTGSPRSAGGRSGPGGSIDRVYLDRYSQRVGDPVRMDRSRSMGSTGIFLQTPRFNPRNNARPTRGSTQDNHPPAPTRRKTPIQPADSPETTIPRPQPAGKRHSKPRNTPYQPIPHPNPRNNARPTRGSPQDNHPPASTRGTTPDQLADPPKTTNPPLQPAEQRQTNSRIPPKKLSPHPNPRKNPTPTRVILQPPTPTPNLRHSLTPTGAQRQRTPPTDPFQASVQSSKFPYTKD